MTHISTFPGAEQAAERAARDIAQQLRRAREARGTAHLALSGGGTPVRAYELLTGELSDWDGIEVWFADERCVAPEDEQSNYLMARRTLLEPVRIPAARVHRMQGELGPDDGAARYASTLRELVPAQTSLPALDLVVLGIGPDGHVASLFPGAPALDAGEQELCLGVHASPKPPPRRITLSLPVLCAARRCLLLATGAEKRPAVTAALGEPTREVPASLLRRERLSVILDDDASPSPPGG